METITNKEMRDYLAAHNWGAIDTPSEVVEIWREQSDGGGELLLPTDNALDKETVLQQAIAKLAEIKSVTKDAILVAIRAFFQNAIAIRVIHHDVVDGTIPLEDGVALNREGLELVAAAGHTAISRQPSYGGRRNGLVSSLIKSARLGQTSHGSYVVNIFYKDPPGNKQPFDFAQKTTETLQIALSGLEESLFAYEESGDPAVFESAFSSGASSNLCDAVARLAGKDRARTVEISMSPKNDGRLTHAPKTVVTFSPERQSSLRAASEYFKRVYTLKDETITGHVERLDRHANEDGGVVRVAATLSTGDHRNVRVHLNPEEYQVAIHAHDVKSLVTVKGSIAVMPRGAEMAGAQGFALFGNRDIFEQN